MPDDLTSRSPPDDGGIAMPGLFDRLQGELEAQEKAAGLSIADVLELPDQLRQLVNWMMREGDVSLSGATATGCPRGLTREPSETGSSGRPGHESDIRS